MRRPAGQLRSLAAVWTLLAVLATGCCLAAQETPEPFVARELALRQARPMGADLERPFAPPLPARLAAQGGRRESVRLTSCRDYLAVRNRIVGSDSDADYRVLRYQGTTCEALALAQRATRAGRTGLPRDFGRAASTRLYPASLWPAVSEEERRSLAAPGSTLQNASGKGTLRPLPDGGLELESEGMGLRLTLLARGDFDGDGWEDAAFRWEAYALEGSYADYRLVVLTGTGGSFRQLDPNRLLAAP